MLKKIFTPKTLIALIFFFGLFLRFYKLGEVPQVLTRDEAAIGYNAYSILKTGRDEYGVKYPLWFLSFGDYKNPLYIYLTALIIPFFGLTEFTVRFLSALSGSLTILVAYLLVKELFESQNNTKKNQKGTEPISLMSSFLLTVAPWHIFYSRMAYEATLALFFVVSGLFFLLKARWSQFFFLPAFLLLLLSFFTYNAPIFILPIFIPIIIFFFKNEYLKRFKLWSLGFLIIFYLSILGYIFLSKNLIFGRSEATVFSKDYFQNQTALMEINNIKAPFGLKFFLRKKPFIFYKLVSNYFSVFKPEFLFFSGDGHLWHGLGPFGYKIGNQYLLTLPFFIIGLSLIFKKRIKNSIFLIVWFFIAPIASTFTQDTPNTTRLHDFLFLYLVISSFGFAFLTKFMIKKNIKVIPTLFILFFIFNTSIYWWTYFNKYQRSLCDFESSAMWLCHVKKIINYCEENKEKYKDIFIVTSAEGNEEPYIQFAFYLKIDPSFFQSEAKRKKNGFVAVKQLDKFHFEELPMGVKISDITQVKKINQFFKKPNRLLISRKINSLIENVPLKEIKRIVDRNNQPLWLFLET